VRLLVSGAAFRVDPPRANKTALHAVGASATSSSEAKAAVAAINAVEQALGKMTSNPRMSPEMLSAAKSVAQEVDQAAKQIESGNSTKAEKMALVGHAITSLQSLQAKWEQSAKDALAKEKAAEDKEKSAATRIAELKKELEQKQEALAKDQNMLKEAQMQKEILEKAEQAEGGSKEEARQQEAELKSLEAMAKNMAPQKAGAGDKQHTATQVHSKVPASLEHVVADLRARAQNLTAAIQRLDSEETKRESELEKATAKEVPTTGKKDAIQQGQKMLTMLKKQAKRGYKKARAVKSAELAELNEAIGSIEKGDVKALSRLMAKMEHESKQLNARSKNFLY